MLSKYGARYEADPQRWLFLTGSMDRIYDIAIKGFKITVEAARENNQIIHDTRFILVDAEGTSRGYYDSALAEELQRLRQDASELVAHGGSIEPVRHRRVSTHAGQSVAEYERPVADGVVE